MLHFFITNKAYCNIIVKNTEDDIIRITCPCHIHVLNKKNLRKMCSSAYYKTASKGLEIQTSEWYEVSFNFTNEALFELIAP